MEGGTGSKLLDDPGCNLQSTVERHAEGSNKTRLTYRGSAFWPVSSNDGGKIAFISTCESNDQIYVMEADGSNQSRLTIFSPSGFPDWSPDGTKSPSFRGATETTRST